MSRASKRGALAIRADVAAAPVTPPDERRVIPLRSGPWRTTPTRDEGRNPEISAVDAILRETAQGQVSRYIDLCESSRTRDSRLDAVCRTRVLAIQGRRWVMRPSPGLEGNAEAQRVALAVTQLFHETQGFATILGHLAHGTLYGHALLEHQWRLDGGLWRTAPRWLHGNRVGFDVQDQRAGWLTSSTAIEPFDRYPNKFVFHNPVGGRSSYPWHRGAMRSRLIASITKRLGIRWWLKMLERWGQPQVFVTRPPSTPGVPGPTGSDEDDDIIDGLRKIGDDWRGVIPAGASINTIAADVKSDLHATFVAAQNLEDAVAILGQNLSTEVTGGSFAAARAHQLVRLDVLAADLAELTETITDQWIRPLCEYNWPGAPVPWIDWILAPQGPVTVAEYQAGLYSADEVRASNGYDAEADNRGRRYAMALDAPAGPAEPDAPDAPVAEPTADVAVADTGINGAQWDQLNATLAQILTGELTAAAARFSVLLAMPSTDAAALDAAIAAQVAAKATAPAAPLPTP